MLIYLKMEHHINSLIVQLVLYEILQILFIFV